MGPIGNRDLKRREMGRYRITRLQIARGSISIVALILTPYFEAPVVAQGVRPGLDYKVVITEGTESKEIVCDICNYAFSDNETTAQTRAVNAKDGYVQLLFMRRSDGPIYRDPAVNPHDITISAEDEFTVDYYELVQVRQGQSVRLRGTSIKLTIVDAFGRGCPPPAVC